MPDQLDKGLALSGGGYRAMLYSLGSLWRLNEMGWLRKIDIITSVSGGSILNGVLATRWPKLNWDSRGVATNFADVIAPPVQKIAGQTVDIWAGVKGLLSVFSTVSDKVADAYDKTLFEGARLQSEIPDFSKGQTPRFLFYATSLQTGSSVRIERKRLADYRIGEIPKPDISVARVVAASSAFPPFLSPVKLKLLPTSWKKMSGAYLFEREDLKRKLLLTDGGVYDNMGLQAIWDRCETVLVSDAGAPLEAEPSPATNWLCQPIRVLNIVTEQARALRRSALMQEFQQSHEAGLVESKPRKCNGTYWGIKTKIDAYGVPDALVRDNAKTERLQHVRTRLSRFTREDQGQLINWGYALTDAAMRKWVDPQNSSRPTWPVPEFSLN